MEEKKQTYFQHHFCPAFVGHEVKDILVLLMREKEERHGVVRVERSFREVGKVVTVKKAAVGNGRPSLGDGEESLQYEVVDKTFVSGALLGTWLHTCRPFTQKPPPSHPGNTTRAYSTHHPQENTFIFLKTSYRKGRHIHGKRNNNIELESRVQSFPGKTLRPPSSTGVAVRLFNSPARHKRKMKCHVVLCDKAGHLRILLVTPPPTGCLLT